MTSQEDGRGGVSKLRNKTEGKVGGRVETAWPCWKWLTQAGFTEFS